MGMLGTLPTVHAGTAAVVGGMVTAVEWIRAWWR